MMIILSIVGIAFVLGLGMMISAIFTAPEGFEDEAGFHQIAGKHSARSTPAAHGHHGLGMKGHASAA